MCIRDRRISQGQALAVEIFIQIPPHPVLAAAGTGIYRLHRRHTLAIAGVIAARLAQAQVVLMDGVGAQHAKNRHVNLVFPRLRGTEHVHPRRIIDVYKRQEIQLEFANNHMELLNAS